MPRQPIVYIVLKIEPETVGENIVSGGYHICTLMVFYWENIQQILYLLLVFGDN